MPVTPGVPAPDIDLPDGEGTRHRLRDLLTQGPAVLTFFKTTCPTCALAFPVLGDVARRYGDAVPVVAVSQDPPAKTAPWLAEHRFDGPFLDDAAGGYAAAEAYGVRSVPTVVLVDGDGTVTRVVEGWDRDRYNELAEDLGRRTGRSVEPVSVAGDGRPVFKPG